MDKYRPFGAKYQVQRRVAGYHDLRMDGMTDLVLRAAGKSVFDIGCNRGLVGFEFANNGASRVDGCDLYEVGVQTAREMFADLRSVESHFEVVDLIKGTSSLSPFAGRTYDITICLATYHKLKRVMDEESLAALMIHFGRWTKGYFAWRATSDKPEENEEEMVALDRDLGKAGLFRIHTSYISTELGVAAIWARA